MLDTIFEKHPDLDTCRDVLSAAVSTKGATSEGKEIEISGANLGPAKNLLGNGDKKVFAQAQWCV